MINERFQKILFECRNELDRLNIPYDQNITTISVNTRAKSRWGYCRLKDNKFSIQLSVRLLECSDIDIKNTLIHELLHTVPKCLNHGKNWKRYADIVNAQYGYNIKRTTTSDEKGIKPSEARYTVRCSTCDMKWKYHRYTRTLKNIKDCKCPRCRKPNLWIYDNSLEMRLP